MLVPVTIFDPAIRPIRGGVKSALHPALLGEGDFTRIQGFRWDDGSLLVTGGSTQYLAAPDVSPAPVLVDKWEGELNGTSYIVAAFNVGTKIELWYSAAGAAWERITEVGGFHGGTTGDSRFSTQSGRGVFAPIKTPKGTVAGVSLPSRDTLMIFNGEDENRLWDPGRANVSTIAITDATNASPIVVTTGANHNMNDGDTVVISGVTGNTAANGSWFVDRTGATTFRLFKDEALTVPVAGNGAYGAGGTFPNNHRLTVHKKITVPTDANLFRQTAISYKKWQVAGAAGKTFALVGVNPARYQLGNGTPIAPYSGSNTCIQFDMTTAAAAADIATCQFSTQLNLGKQLKIVMEDQSPAGGLFDDLIATSRIEINPDNVAHAAIASPWITVYDPTSANEELRRVFKYAMEPENIPAATSPPEVAMWTFPTDHLAAADRLAYHIRFVKVGSDNIPAANTTGIILAIFGGGVWPGTTEWQMSYEDEYSRAESPRIVSSVLDAAEPRHVGGPDMLYKYRLPIDEAILYDFDLVVRNSDAATTFAGGLNGEPSRFNLHARLPGEDTAFYAYSVIMFDAGFTGAPSERGWLKLDTDRIIHHRTDVITDTYPQITPETRDFDRAAPSDYQIVVPPAYVALSANNRLFVANVKDGTQNVRGDGYLSGRGRPFHFQSVQESEDSGSRFNAPGERFQGLLSAAAEAQGASTIHAWTDRGFYALGGSGPFASDPFSTSNLSTLIRLSANGTNAPRTIVERNGAFFWLDQEGQFQRFQGGQIINISRLTVDDKPKNVPAARRDQTSAHFHNDRYLPVYTLAAGSANTRMLVWNDVLKTWEADDLPPVNPSRVGSYFDSSLNGSGQRLLLYVSTGVVHTYETGGAVSVRLTTGELTDDEIKHAFLIHSVVLLADNQANTLTIDRLYRQGGIYRTTLSLVERWVTDSIQKPVTVVAQPDGIQQDKAVQLDIYGTMTAGTRLMNVTAILQPTTTVEARQG